MSNKDFILLSNIFHYDPFTGRISYRVAQRKVGRSVGDTAGYLNERGYKVITFSRKRYYGHRIAWLLFYGEWPNGILDHIDRNKSNNQIQNLRVATSSQNQANTEIRKFQGAYFDKSKWYASIVHNGVKYFLGSFISQQAAHEAYMLKRKELKNV